MKLFSTLSFFFVAYLASRLSISVARLLNSLSELDANGQYDFIIVGGGTAGSVLANRLSEDGTFRILMVEAGVNNEGFLILEAPFMTATSNLVGGPFDWNYTTIPQAGANGIQITVPRGFVLGGSSSINSMIWYRCSNDMWDNFAKITGDESWSWDAVSKYYLKTSKLVSPQDDRNIDGDIDPSAHGDGPLNITLSSSPPSIVDVVEAAAKSSDGRFGFNVDYNSGNTLGMGWAQSTTGGGIRNSAATAYLQPAMKRPNLDILIHTRATKLHSSEPVSEDGKLMIRTVELASNATGGIWPWFSPSQKLIVLRLGSRINITARREVILSAGSLNTPQLLLLSGIGPKEDLEPLGIPVLHNSPGVGANLTEHPVLPIVFSVDDSVQTWDDVLRNTSLQDQLLDEWQVNRTGIYVNGPAPFQGNVKLSARTEDLSSGATSGSVMFIFVTNHVATALLCPSRANTTPTQGKFLSVISGVMTPTSRGSLKLSSSDPFDPPLIDYAMYSTNFDVDAQVEAVKIVQEFLNLPQFNRIVQGPFGDLANATTDEEIATHVRATPWIYNHPSCSASMGPGGAVDTRLKVKGVDGLRIVDASVFAAIPSKKHHMKPFSIPSLFAIAYLAIWPFITAARLLNSLSELDVNSQYDFIIVGGGTAGSVLANRLTEDDAFKVLVVEAGVNNEGYLISEVPYMVVTSSFVGGPLDWNYTTVPQPGANGRQISVPRGFVLGGSSSINSMIWYRCSNDMWDNFAKITGDKGWSWDSVSKYYLKTSKLVLPQDGRDITGDVNPSAHGNGPLNITLGSSPPDIIQTVETAAKSSDGRFAFNLDYNSGNTLGIGWTQSTTGGGIRNSAATGYLHPAVQRPSLDVLIHTRATKLYELHPTTKEKTTTIRTVELASNVTGPRVNITARREIILSAGSLNTPQLLLLSGIGPKEDLKASGISVVLDSPGVGANLTEQPLVPSVFSVNPSTQTLDDFLRNKSLQAQLLDQWQQNRTGTFANSAGPIQGNFKLPGRFEDPSSGPRSGNIMIVFSPNYHPLAPAPLPPSGKFFSAISAVMSPTSRVCILFFIDVVADTGLLKGGSLKLSSSNPFDPPLIDYALYSTDFDINAQVEAMKMIREFVGFSQFSGTVQGLFGDLANATTDDEIAAYIRATPRIYHHPSCSASMGPGGVVDTRLKVKGVHGLRIVDASVFIPECNTQAPVYVLAERAADSLPVDVTHSTAIMKQLSGLSLLVAVYLFVWPSRVASRLLNNLSELNINSQYDFIIVGGGTAGSVLANRLTEDGVFKVLVVEAGVNNEGVLNSEVPFLASRLYGGPLDWNYTTVPQPGANGRRINVPRGFVLGGSSSINTMLWYRGSDDMWDNFAKLTGDQGWSWNSVSKYYLKTSKLVGPQDGRDITGEADPSAHGNGPLNITLLSYPPNITAALESAAKSSYGRFAFNLDYNSGNTLGIGWTQQTIGGGIRNSAATGYLQPAIQRANLDVLIHTRVTRLLPTPSTLQDDTLIISTVELATDATGKWDLNRYVRRPRVNVSARKEIILSAGSLNTPQVLLLSGIGPKEDLEALGITAILDSRGVGANLTEHPLMSIVFSVSNSTQTLDEVLRNATLQTQLLSQWQGNRTGIYVNSLAPIQGNVKLPTQYEDPSSGLLSGNIMLGFVPYYFQSTPPPSSGNFLTVVSAVISPTSRGSLKLSSSNPFDPPLIDYALYSTNYDINAQVEAVKMTQEFLSLPQFNGIVQGLFGDLANATTDDQIAAYIKANSRIYAHPSCSASMGPGGVVDSRLKLKGVHGLRVVDASVFPQIPECNTQAPVYILAERAAELIRDEYLCK
ncbi:hypothetical protein VNI00_003692 [Paramarasmius palmivorus]|uniref:Glucose-methanol-choline oxidoreductase N-terminal domain-containing protein n=1 Tax=Paramarasmius palmivorus TaxID=297713 RepID=A0AAW0DT31_9AGAR